MIGYIYKTTNTINKKIYIGKHQSSEYDDKYFGSGKILKRAIDKYGIENFINEIIDIADTDDELNEKEKYYIKYYKDLYGENCYNLANGGDGGDVFKYQPLENKQHFIDKMTIINKQRCNTEDFKNKLSKATSKRYQDINERKSHSKKAKEVWSDEKLRKEQSDRLKDYYSTHEHDCSFNFISCVFKLNDTIIQFESIKDLRKYLLEEYQYNPDRRTFNRLMELGRQGIPYKPFHKNNEKLRKLSGMLIYKLDKSVETNSDECNCVGQEIGTCPKCETT